MKFLFGIVMLLTVQSVIGQELFVFAEPASNMPAHSISAKVSGRFPLAASRGGLQRYSPELMFGLNKNLMIHATGFFSNFYQTAVQPEAVRLYGKYRFLSVDEVHMHFRLAAYGGASYSKNPFNYEDINLAGDNTGIEAGVIATQLVNRFALSLTAGYLQVGKTPELHIKTADRKALEYTLSAGYLIFPKEYTSFEQPNLNIYLEAIGMQGLERGGKMIDLAPSLQLILNSNLKINASYRFQLLGEMHRLAERGIFLSLERTFLGVLRKK